MKNSRTAAHYSKQWGPEQDFKSFAASHEHDHSDLSETELRVRALETILTEKGYVDPAALDAIIQAYETKIGPGVNKARTSSVEHAE